MYKHNDRCIDNAFDDEMLFVLMARDPTAPATIKKWIKLNLHRPKEQIAEAMIAIETMELQHTTIRGRMNQVKKAPSMGMDEGADPMISKEGMSTMPSEQYLGTLYELERLRQWKKEAIEVMGRWDRVKEYVQQQELASIGDAFPERVLETLKRYVLTKNQLHGMVNGTLR